MYVVLKMMWFNIMQCGFTIMQFLRFCSLVAYVVWFCRVCDLMRYAVNNCINHTHLAIIHCIGPKNPQKCTKMAMQFMGCGFILMRLMEVVVWLCGSVSGFAVRLCESVFSQTVHYTNGYVYFPNI